MKILKDNGYLILVRLSNIELYYSSEGNISDKIISLTGEEFNHAVKVMRNDVGDTLYITDGAGLIFKTEILSIERDKLSVRIIETIKTESRFENIFFCIPKLKNPNRLKFAIEKCVELGVVNFIVFESSRTISKGSNKKRWEKVALSAMKQSLRAYLPKIQLVNNLSNLAELNGEKIIFEQNSSKQFKFNNDEEKIYYFIFGPEGGLEDDEINILKPISVFTLSANRLRSETAIVKVASLL